MPVWWIARTTLRMMVCSRVVETAGVDLALGALMGITAMKIPTGLVAC